MSEAAPAPEEGHELPKLSPAEFREYNRLAEIMNQFHNHFRLTWKQLYATCSPGSTPEPATYPPLSPKQFLNKALSLIEHLSTHHSIEERHVFPHLARKMAIFSSSPAQLLVKQHEEIHNGMDKLEKYVKECLSGVRDLRMEEVKNIMDEFGGVLWDHLDREVYELGAERMRKFWSLGEMREMPF